MEKELFEWTTWDGDLEAAIFMGCTLKVPIGKFKAGDQIPSICILFEKGVMQLFDEDGETQILEVKVRLALILD